MTFQVASHHSIEVLAAIAQPVAIARLALRAACPSGSHANAAPIAHTCMSVTGPAIPARSPAIRDRPARRLESMCGRSTGPATA